MQHRSALTDRRDPLKGIAILWVCFFHARLGLEDVPVLGALQQTGYLGVDIFLLLSGFGLWHSLEHSPTTAAYLKRRMLRLLPAFLPVAALWCLTMIPALRLTGWDALHTAVGTLTMTGYLTGAPYTLNWYISLLLLTILLAPLVHLTIKRAKHPYLCCAALLIACGLCGLLFIGHERLMLISRLPIFVLGMGLAGTTPRQQRPKTAALLCAAGFLMGAALLWLGFARRPEWLIRYGLYWYPAFLLVPGLCAGLGFMMDRLAAAGLRFPILTALGKASFEIFLFNGWFELYLKYVLRSTEPLIYLLWTILSVMLGLVWHMGVERLTAGKRRTPAAKG